MAPTLRNECLLHHSSPWDYCGEIIRLFYAKGITYGKQHLDDDEFLDVIKMPIKEVITKIMTNEIKDSKTIAAVFKLKELMNL